MSTVDALALAVQCGAPVLLWGAPGTGKSSAVVALGASLDLPVEVVIASIREPADFAGLPVVRPEGVTLEPPAWARRLAAAGRGLLFLDEITTAPPAVQAALLRVVLDRAVGDLPLPAEVAVVAAANPPEQAAGGWDLSAPLANRLVHLQWQLDAADWVAGTLGGWARGASVARLPADWERGLPAANAIVAAFVRARPHLLLQVPREEAAAGHAWPSPRSWTRSARLLAARAAAGVAAEVEHELVIGCVGEGAGLEFLAWRRALDLPDPEALLADPAAFRLPARGDQQFAVLAAVAAAVQGRPTRPRWLAAWEVLGRAAEQGAADLAAAAARALSLARQPGWPTPSARLASFLPVLRAAGLIR